MSDSTVAAVRVCNARKTYQSTPWSAPVVAVDDVSIEVPDGAIHGLLGPNGAGKTTTLKMLLGLVRPTSGTFEVLGKPSDRPANRVKLGFLPEQPYFYEYLTALEFLDFYGRLFGMGKAERKARAAELLPLVGLAHAGNLQLRKFSKGMLQRIGIAQALINDPELVVLDEEAVGHVAARLGAEAVGVVGPRGEEQRPARDALADGHLAPGGDVVGEEALREAHGRIEVACFQLREPGTVDDELDKEEAALRARAAVGPFAVDNHVAAIRLNGHSVTVPPHGHEEFGFFHPFSCDRGFVEGTNVLEIDVENGDPDDRAPASLMGLLVELDGSALSAWPEPSSCGDVRGRPCPSR